MSTDVVIGAHWRVHARDSRHSRGCDFQSRAESVGFSRQSFQPDSQRGSVTGRVQSGSDRRPQNAGWRTRDAIGSEPVRRAWQTDGPQHNANDAASKSTPRRILLAEAGSCGWRLGDKARKPGTGVRTSNGTAPRTHRRMVDGTPGEHGSESREGPAGRRGAPAQRRRGI